MKVSDQNIIQGGPVLPAAIVTQAPATDQHGQVVLPPDSRDRDAPTTQADVVAWFIKYLNRRPAWEEVAGRLGQPRAAVETDIATSPEADMVRAGNAIPVGPQGPQGPPPGPGPVGPTGPQGPKSTPKPPTAIHIPGLDDATNAVLGAILDQLGGLHDSLATIEAGVADDVAKAVAAAAPIIEKAEAAITAKVSQVIDTVLPGIGSVLLSAFGGIESLVAAFLSNAADVTDLSGAFTAAVKAESDSLGMWIAGLVGAIVQHGATTAASQLAERLPEPRPPLGGGAAEGEELPPELEIPVNPVVPPGDLVAGLSQAVETAIGVVAGVLAYVEPGQELMRQYAWANAPVQIPDAGTAAAAEVRGFISAALAHEIARRRGVDAPAHSIARELAKVRPGADALFTGYFRGHLGADELDRGLLRLGFDARAREILGAAAFTIADVGAMMRVAERGGGETGTPDVIEGDDELTAPLLAELRRWGISAAEAATLWRAHYRPLDPMSAAELIHRGHLAPEAYPAILQANGVAPFARALLPKILYTVYSRRDWLRLVKLGLLDHQGLKVAIMENGYAADRAEILATMFEQLAATDVAAEKKRLAEEHKKIVLALLADGFIDQSNAMAQLGTLGFSDDEANSLTGQVMLTRQVKLLNTAAALIKPFYVQSLWTREETATEMQARGFPTIFAANLLDEWTITRDLRELTAAEKAGHDAQAAELRQAFIENVLDEQAYRDHLAALRFTQDAVEISVSLALIAKHKATLADSEAVIHDQLVAGELDETSASNALDKLGVGPSARDRLMNKWLKELRQLAAAQAKAVAAAGNGTGPAVPA